MSEKSGYSDSQIDDMQKDAIKRVKEMQRVANQRLGSTRQIRSMNSFWENSNVNNLNQKKSNFGEKNINNQDLIKKPSNKPVNSSGFDLNGLFKLDFLNMDDDKMMILLLIIILSKEGADTMLILALFYLII